MSPQARFRSAGPSPGGFDHRRWLDLVEVSGPFLSIPVLRRAWPAGLDPLDRKIRDRLRAEHEDYFDVPASDRDREHWLRYVLGDLLGWSDLVRWEPDAPQDLVLAVPEHGEMVAPAFMLTGQDGSARLLGLVSDGQPTGRVVGSAWSASPADRLALLLRQSGVPLGLVTDGRWWVLVRAPRGKATTYAAFDASLWREERDLARAFVSLLGRARFFGVPDEETLPALLDRSEDNQEEITEVLGVQVRRAVELLIRAIGQAEEEVRRHRPEILPLDAHEAYVGAVTVMMRLVFLLFAEDCRLLPNDDPVYQSYYSASRLVDDLEEQASEPGGEAAMMFSHAAWHRLLALFRAVHGGISAGELQLAAYDGSLFDPGAHPWLEGRFEMADGDGTEVLRIDDRTVMHMLRAVQYVEVGTGKGRERRRLTFSNLDVEQIGYVYEGLLGFDAFRADDVVLGLIGRPGEEEEISLTDLEEFTADAVRGGATDVPALAARLADRFRNSGIGSPSAIARRLTPLPHDELPDARRRLLSATGNDAPLADRLMAYYGLLRTDLAGLPTVFRKGTLYVTESPLRRFTGTHYTPRFLAEQVVQDALAPLVYSPGPLQTGDARKWKPRPSAEILKLKIADIAVGSAAFLVAAARYLGDRLIEAWAAQGDERAQRVAQAQAAEEIIDAVTDPVVIEARRLIIEHCLYGADINPMAIEMAKLSLWLISMDPSKPFTFVDDKLAVGDSLLGITSLEQLEWMHLDPKRGRALHENLPYAWTQGAAELAVEVAGLRERIARLSDAPGNYPTKRALLGQARDRVARAGQLADLVTGAALAETARKRSDSDPSMVAANLARIATGDTTDAWDNVTDQARDWLDIDYVPGSFPRTPLHWPLAFPEVFLENGGFDAIIGNPPFLGGSKISPAFGSAYREFLVSVISGNAIGKVDLVAYFFLRAHSLLNSTGIGGLLGTNSLAQGATRTAGIGQIVRQGTTIIAAIKSEPWPSKGATLEYCIVWTSKCHVAANISRTLDGREVGRITPSLDEESRVTGEAHRLSCNDNIAFLGSKVTGIERFALTPEKAHALIEEEGSLQDVLYPFLGGKDLNTEASQSPTRWVVNFHDWSLERAASYSKCFEYVKSRTTRDDTKGARPWWQYEHRAPSLYNRLKNLKRAIALAEVSKTLMPSFVPTGITYSHTIIVIAIEDAAQFAALCSSFHYLWAVAKAGTMRADPRYVPSSIFETFVMPDSNDFMRGAGERLDRFRRELMMARQAGLTKTYNLVHNPKCADSDIAELRNIHQQIDVVAAHAYGWDDLDLDHGFHETQHGIRYTVGPAARQEILDRLLELNHERYAAEVAAGLHKGGKQASGGEGMLF